MSKNHDALIVGSGPVGTAIARRLAERGLRTTVLEAGSAATDPPGSHLRNQPRFRREPDGYFAAIEPHFVPLGDPAADGSLPGAADSALVGGQGALWTNNCPRAADFELWDAMTPEQWARYYASAEDLLEVVADPSAASRTGHAVEGRLGPILAGEGRDIRGLPLSGRVSPEGDIHFIAPWDMLQGAAPAVRNHITLRPDIRATRLRHIDGRVTGVDVEGPGADTASIDAPVVVVAGGAVATPQLLHRSGITPAALGRGISFHALLFGQVVLDASMCPAAEQTDLAPRQWIPPTAGAPWHVQVLRDTCPLPATEPVDNPHRLLEFQAFLPVALREENALVVDDAGRAAFRFAFSDSDRTRMAAMEADVRRLAGHLGPWRQGCEPIWLPHGSAHLTGTCRMDRADWGGVTDRLGRVHGFDNLYLASVGLFPAPVAVNPTLTAVALALRTCEEVLS